MRAFSDAIEKSIVELDFPATPANLYDPLRYFVALGGKRTRPTLVLMAYELFKSDWQKAIPQAIAIELFHNFTLIHDDIMDKAELRRGQRTVHEKWNNDIAILSGDVLFVKAYDYLIEGNPANLIQIMRVFNETSRLVCEGQQMDMDFEQRSDVSIEEYLEMIKLKTAVLLGCSFKIGALCAGATLAEAETLYGIGVKLGVGVQLQDDYLDAYGDPETFGKQVGGDILNNKKTYLSIQLQKQLSDSEYKALEKISNPNEKILKTKEAMSQCGIDEAILAEVQAHHKLAIEELDKLEVPNGKNKVVGLAAKLMERVS